MVRFLFMDVDGTLTDGKIYMSSEGELFKAFNIKDGCGIKDILPDHSIIPVIITARNSKILEKRCAELGIKHLYQGERNKYQKILEIISQYSEIDKIPYDLSDTAYIGDDILDLQCMEPIRKSGGITGCPADAVDQVKECSDHISMRNGGDGAVRDFIEYLIRKQ